VGRQVAPLVSCGPRVRVLGGLVDRTEFKRCHAVESLNRRTDSIGAMVLRTLHTTAEWHAIGWPPASAGTSKISTASSPSIPQTRKAPPVEIEIDARTLSCGEPNRDADPGSADFLDVEHYPPITIRANQIWKSSGVAFRSANGMQNQVVWTVATQTWDVAGRSAVLLMQDASSIDRPAYAWEQNCGARPSRIPHAFS